MSLDESLDFAIQLFSLPGKGQDASFPSISAYKARKIPREVAKE